MAQDLKKVAKKMKKKGRYGDSELVHVNPSEKKMLLDMRGGIGTKNPDTGLDEFFSLSNPFKSVGKFVKKIGKNPIGAIGDAVKLAGILSGNPLYAAGGTLVEGVTSGDKPGQILKNTALNGIGSYASGSLFPETTAAFKSYLPDVGLSGLSDSFNSGISDAYHSIMPGTPSLGLGDSSSFLPSNFSSSMQLGDVGSPAVSSFPSASASSSLGDILPAKADIGNFLKTPQGLAIAASALGALTDNGKDPYAASNAQKKAEDKNYIRYNNGAPVPYTYAKGGSVAMDSDTTRQPRQDPRAARQLSDTVRQIETQIGRQLDDDEVRDLIGRMGAGIGQVEPAPYADGGPVSGIGSGKSDDIPAMLSDGEHVITADEVSMLGDGSNNAGHKKLYAMRKKLRKHKTGQTKQMPMAKSPESYAGIGA